MARARGVIAASISPFVEVKRILPDVDEHGNRTAEHEGVRRRYKCVGRHDHFIARLQVQKQGGEVETCGTGGGEEPSCAACLFVDPAVAAPSEKAVAGRVRICNRLS